MTVQDALAEKLIDEGNYAEAIKRLEEVVERRDDPGLRLRLATCLFREGKLGDALVHSRRVSENESEHREDALLLLAWCLRSLRRWREGARTYLEFAGKYPSSNRMRIARFSAALCLEELDDWTGAIDIYKSIGDDESDFRAAICLERSGRKDEAAALFEEFLRRHSGSPEMLKVRFRLGALRLRQGKVEQAIEHLAEAASIGAGSFVGEMAQRLLDRAKVKKVEFSKKIRGYS